MTAIGSMPAPPQPPAAVLGASAEVNAGLSLLGACFHQIDRSLRGFASAAAQEKARRDLGQLMHAASALRDCLPDASGLRTGTGAQRAARAVAVFQTDHRTPPTRDQVAALLEVSPGEAQGLLLRASLKNWVRVVEVTGQRPQGDRWGLTPDGVAFTGFVMPADEADAVDAEGAA